MIRNYRAVMRVESCTGKCSKTFLLLINILVFLAGGAMLGFGVFYHLEGGLYQYVLNEAGFITVPAILMLLGCLFVTISFFAIIGALCEVVFMLKIYMGILAIVLLLEALLMAVCIAMRGDTEKQVIEAVHELMEHYGNDTSDELSVITETIDQTQEWLKCCGLEGPGDWGDETKAEYWAATHPNGTLPDSCCIDSSSTCTRVTDGTTNIHYTDGCRLQLYDFVDKNTTYISVVGIGLIMVQCMILICSLKIRFELDNRYDCEEFATNMEVTSL